MTGIDAGLPKLTVGRYAIYGEIAAGGMATVHFGRLLGPAGFSRTVAVKRLHPQFAKDAEFVAMFLDEARLAARIRHPNVVPTLDVVAVEGEVLLVMDYVHGESLGRLIRAVHGPMQPSYAATLLAGALHGLHAAHVATNERGDPLGIVHRDVSPQNILVGVDGSPRLVDFGVAKAVDRAQTTREGQLKGKFSYMAPEQLLGETVTPRTDVFAASVVLWEALTGRRLFRGDSAGAVVSQILNISPPPPSKLAPDVPKALDDIVKKGICREPEERFASAEEMALALENALAPVTAHTLGKWVASVAGTVLSNRTETISAIETASSQSDVTGDIKRAVEMVRASSPAIEAPGISRPPASQGSQPSQLSTITVEQVAGLQRSGSKRGAWVIAALLTIVAVGIGTFLVSRRAPGPSGVAATGAAPSAPAMAAPEPVPAVPRPEPAPSASEPAPEQSASASAPAPEPVVRKAPAAKSPPVSKSPPASKPATKKPSAASDDDLMNVRK